MTAASKRTPPLFAMRRQTGRRAGLGGCDWARLPSGRGWRRSMTKRSQSGRRLRRRRCVAARGPDDAAAVRGVTGPIRGSAKFQQLLHGDPCLVQNLPQSSRADSLVIRHDDAGVRVPPPQDDVAPSLAVNGKSHPQKCLHQLLAGKVRRELHWWVPVLSSKYSLPASVGTGSPAAIQSST